MASEEVNLHTVAAQRKKQHSDKLSAISSAPAQRVSLSLISRRRARGKEGKRALSPFLIWPDHDGRTINKK